MSSLLSYVWLSLKRGLGNYLRAEVLRRMGSPEAVYAADSTMLAQSCPSLRRQHGGRRPSTLQPLAGYAVAGYQSSRPQ